MSSKILWVSLSLILLFSITSSGYETMNANSADESIVDSYDQKTPSFPITILKDEDFQSYELQGSGLVSDPYIIENLTIEDDTSSLTGILIANTSRYFIIQNCFITDFEYGIQISNIEIETGIVSNNTIYDCNNAMMINKTSTLRIQNNNCTTSQYYGIALFDSDNCIITSNLIHWSRLHGIFLNNNSKNNNIHHNFFVLNNCKIYHAHPYYAWPQAFDSGSNNKWYDITKLEGNYWEDWSERGGYYIDGSSSSQDPFPYRDLDGDILDDYKEITFFGTSHLTSDSDQDELNDREEIYIYYTDPWIKDSDSDGYFDGEEVFLGTDPLDKNDHPGVQEASYLSSALLLTFLVISTLVYSKIRRKEK